jgi:adenine-specific DNA-methyltransferase
MEIKDRKSFYKAKIDKIPPENFNAEQKITAKRIIDSADEEHIDAIYQMITQRIKTGFVFDVAPEVNHNCVCLAEENEKLGINLNRLNSDNTHLLIIGENYDALKNLLVTYIDRNGHGLIDVIYIDPPYNTEKSKEDGNDYKSEVAATKFIYRDKFTRDGWLNMMNERLRLAKRVLSDAGVIFISIDNAEQAYLKVLCDEIFGEDSFVTAIHCQLSTTQGMKVKVAQNGNIVKNAEYILCYTKDGHKNIAKKPLYDLRYEYDEHYSLYLRKNGEIGHLTELYDYRFPKDCSNKKPMSLSEAFKKSEEFADIVRSNLNDIVRSALANFVDSQLSVFAAINDLRNGYWKLVNRSGQEYLLTLDNCGTMRQLLRLSDSWGKTDGYYEEEGLRKIRGDWWEGFYIDMCNVAKEGDVDFKNGKKPVRLIKQLIKMTSDKNSNILDFYAGSGTTGQAVMELNDEDGGTRKFILCTNNEGNIALDITRRRLLNVINGRGTRYDLSQNVIRIFEIKHYPLKLKDLEKAEEIKAKAEKEFVKMNPEYTSRNEFDVYNELASLNPYKTEV